MSKKTFNPAKWQPAEPIKQTALPAKSLSFGEVGGASDIDTITQRIESTATDIAPNYADWRDLGFALADALGENGRTYYHRLSKFYPHYNQTETDKQFDNCIKSHGHGITVKTFFHLARQAGIEISNQKLSKYPNIQNGNMDKVTKSKPASLQNISEEITSFSDEEIDLTPTFPENIYSNLPFFLQRVTAKAISPEDKDLLLLGSLVVLSACLPNVFGNYDERRVYPNLFLFLTASASAGKGRLTLCRKLVYPIHKALRERYKILYDTYKQEKAMNSSTKKDQITTAELQEPPMLALLMPANSSATAFFQILNDNNGVGLMFETEGDTLAQTFKSEHGNFSDGFRKAFHHETISYLRRKDREFVELENPRLSALLSGTPKQVSALIPNAENGLFSRFIFYYMNIKPVWKDVFANPGDQTLDNYFKGLGEHFYEFYRYLNTQSEMRFCLTVTQQIAFNEHFSQAQLQFLALYGDDYIATVRRLGLITFRISMIMTVLRLMEDQHFTTPLICCDADFNTALEMVKILVQHAAKVFEALPVNPVPQATSNPKLALLQALPSQFERAKYIEVAAQLQIPESTADKQIARFCKAGLLVRQAHGNYLKTN